jgi:hypothetical protein
MSFTSSSQDLIPDKVLFTAQDTLFCWGQVKSRLIAKKFIRSYYCDSISAVQETKMEDLRASIQVQKNMMDVLYQQKKNQEWAMALRDKENTNLSQMLKRQKFFTWLGFGTAGALGALLIFK